MSKVVSGTPWTIVCTDRFDQTIEHFIDLLGLPMTAKGVPSVDKQFQRYAQFTLPGGPVLEIVEPIESLANLYRGTIYSMTVDDVSRSRADMESKGIKFISPIFEDGQGSGWTYYQLPSGQIFQIQGYLGR